MSKTGEAMGAALPLERYGVIRTRDLDEARQEVARYFWSHRLDMHGPGRRLDTRFHHAPLACASLNFVRYGADLTVDAGEPPNCYMVKLILRGGVTVHRGTESWDAGAGRFVLTRPNQYLKLRFWPGTDMLVFKVPHGRLETHAGAMRGDGANGPLRPAFRDDAVPMEGSLASFGRALFLLREELDAGDSLLGSDLGRGDYEDFLLSALLHAWPGAARDEVSGPCPAAVRRAVDYLDAHAHGEMGEAVTTANLVAAAGLGASALYAAFRAHLGCTPMQYLRRRRLDAAQRALADPADPRSVTEIALDHGFGHLGRFSGLYRETFGEAPVETRRRSWAARGPRPLAS